MTFWRNIASLAARRVDAVEASLLVPVCTERPGDDPTFSTAVTALGAKLARADGQANGSVTHFSAHENQQVQAMALWAMTTLVAADAMPGMLWCSASQ